MKRLSESVALLQNTSFNDNNMSRQDVVNVIPYARLPWNAPYFFSYLIPSSLPTLHIGAWVSIPFRNATLHGLVVSINAAHETKMPLKPLYGLVPYMPVGKPFVRLISAVAQDTLNHPSRFLKLAHIRSPEPFMSTVKSRSFYRRKRKDKPILVWWSREFVRNKYIIERAHAFMSAQHLILAPTNERIFEIIDLLNKNKIDAVSFTSRTSQKEIATLVLRTLSGAPCVVVGTRAALFLPFARLCAITIDDEEHPAFTQTAPPPRYHLHRIVEFMRALYQAEVLTLSACPSFAAFHKSDIRERPLQGNETAVDIIDCSKNNLTLNPLHPQVLDRMRSILQNKKNALIITAQSGYASFLKCNECHYIFRCPACAHLLSRETAESDELICVRCGYREAIPPFCPHCNGLFLRFTGFGPARIIEYLRSQSIPSGDLKSALREPSCVVGKVNDTIHGLHRPIGMVALINTDVLLARPWFTATERTFQELTKWRMLSKRYHATFCIQTSVPDHPVCAALLGDTISFYNEELKLRKKLSYPPFARIIHIIIPLPHPHAESKLKPQIDALVKNVKACGFSSTPLIFVYRRKIKSMAFSIRGDESGNQKNYDHIFQLLKSELPARAVIDVDPDSL